MATGVVCDDAVAHTFEDFKLQRGDFKGVTYITYKLNDKKDKIIVDMIGEKGASYDDFIGSLGEEECRYAVVDAPVTTDDGRETSKLIFISFIPDTAKIKMKMVYAGSKETLKSALVGIGIVINANDFGDLDYESCIKPLVLKFA
mmetsp:Transcript_12268/g.17856  ORF Transcript_12268/g.17856 Transcript_12268/m.17856 type:complete len:145 (-) Transcript_12268:260-694(-)|eukprot:CAMPEP_0197234664 /NCGR_PEP_ID=MMETSP1429-20130617/2362_1 /TAXON_ID=49237 /ORGANISM="Chaetoceros  sp., Strain UNC1202" /LENGTH=144 /DNA_ID=CAMNT_0042693127 /DNA_START=50 /DNA_END=484 /DNA_ORIENTATION=-